MTDEPNHLARQYVLRDLSSSPELQRFYSVHWELIPNLALEIFILGLRWAMPLPIAMRLFCIVTVLLLFLGTRWINRIFSDGQSRIYRAVPILCWGGPMQYGFLGYCLGIGLGLVGIGCWLRLRDRALPVRSGFLAVAGVVLILCHLAAFGLFAIAVGMCEMADRRRMVRIWPPFLTLTAILLVFALFSPTIGQAEGNRVEFSSLFNKARAFLAIVFYTSPVMEGGLLAAALLGLMVALLTRTVRWNRVGLGIILAQFLIWIPMPSMAIDVVYIEYRLPWAISFFALASLVPGEQRQWVRPFVVWFGALSVARITLISLFWLRWEPTFAAIDEALGQVPVGSRVMTIVGDRGDKLPIRNPDLTNAGAYAVIRRQGFEPGIFASIPGQILELTPHYRALAHQDGFPESARSDLTSLEPDYNYVLVLWPEATQISENVASSLVLTTDGPHFRLFKITPSRTD